MQKLPIAFKRIRLELARSREYPAGSATHGYEFVAPLDAHAHIDPTLWHKYRDRCHVRRFWGDNEQVGHLVHKPGGTEHAIWSISYDSKVDADEKGYRFGAHAFSPGEYVSLSDSDGEMHTYRVAAVTPPI